MGIAVAGNAYFYMKTILHVNRLSFCDLSHKQSLFFHKKTASWVKAE